ncbi:helix-turn-helix domain-containing protein [Halobaculum limi]|uniref:helix-turn-helix domain-containing protein n=1 Tax=Halobaculum limi TaxID=3031916 RepID=UPI002405F11E|nr:helix-turn-helix domain-containing protein [Halobaculum sp. YSMS11]
MTVLARISIDEDDFELGRALQGVDDAVVELERVIPTPDEAVPYFWVRNTTADAVADALADTNYVSDVALVDELDETLLYRCHYQLLEEGVVSGFVKSGLTILSGVGRNGVWTFDVRTEEHDNLGTFQRYCIERGVDLRLESLTEDVLPDPSIAGLTDAQRQALTTALATGYYDTPRTATLDDVADHLGITRQSASERLRRGTRNILEDEFGAEAARLV